MAENTSVATSIGLLVLRLGAGGLLVALHGADKLLHFSDKKDSFPDPLSIGPQISLFLAGSAEGVCAAAVALGLFTRLACLPVIATMAVAAFVFHAGDPIAAREMALLYLIPFTALAFTGPGRFSVDHWRRSRRA